MTSEAPHPSRGRRIVFRLAAVVLVPMLVLAGVEGLLRVAGVGQPTGALLRSEVDGEQVWIANPWATTVWFGPVAAREATPFAVPVERSARSVRVLVVGGSAVQGDPDPSYSPSRILDRMLRAVLPDRDVEVVNLGMTAINSWVIRDLVRDAVPRLRPDMTVVLMGNNEVVGPYGPATERGPLADHPGLVQLRQRLARLRMVQFAARAVRAVATPAGSEAAEWLGMESLLDREIAADAPELERTYEAFRSNLEAIVDAATTGEGEALLATVPVNLKDCAPFASRHRPDLGERDRHSWQRAFERGVRAADEGRPDDAVAAWAEAATIDDRHAELMYRLAVTHGELGRQSAVGYYHLARDLDALRFRADSRINHIIREVAAERAAAGVRMVDLAGAFAAASDGGVPGDELFYEHVHFTFSGAYLVARELLAPLLEAVGAAGAANLEAVPEPRRVMEQLAFTPWDRFRVGIELAERLRRPPFSGQLDNAKDLETLERWMRGLRELLGREGLDSSVETYRGQLAAFP
ncbi:MAG: SGNH/GDSL hydrolase family protein, partial [Acidimicrobiia bacterium]|nr:SGNH/GDSL hydrolase family protein [Acidimicrobiia bacterium]